MAQALGAQSSERLICHPGLAPLGYDCGEMTRMSDLIVVTGSFYLVGEAKKYLMDLEAKRAGRTGVALED